MDFEQEQQRQQQIKEQYSQQFVDELIAKEKAASGNGPAMPVIKPSSKVAGFDFNKLKLPLLIGLVVLFLLGLIPIFSSGGNKKLIAFANLYVDSTEAGRMTDRYKDLIDNIQIRVHNAVLNGAIISLQSDLDQIKSAYGGEQQKLIDGRIKRQVSAIADVSNRLDRAELNETLDRSYLQEALLIIKQLENDIKAIINLGVSGETNKKLQTHLKSLENVKKAIKETILED